MAKSKLGIAALVVATMTLLLVIVTDSSRLVGKPFPGFMVWDNGMLLAFHNSDWSGIHAGLPTAGRVVEVDGNAFHDRASMMALVAQHPIGASLRYGILWKGSITQIDIPTMRFGYDDYFGTFGVYIFGGTICLMTSLVMLYLKRDTADARAVTVMLFSIGGVLLLAVDFIGASRFGRILPVLEGVTPFAILRFIAVFPGRRMSESRLRMATILGFSIGVLYGLVGASLFYAFPERYWAAAGLAYLAIAIALGLSIVGLGYSVLREPSSVQRVRAVIVFAGALSACLLPTVAVPSFLLLGWNVSWSLIFAPIALFPLAVVYGVVRHDLFEAERFIRLSLGYSVASAVATLLFAVILFTLNRSAFPDLATDPTAALLFVLVLAVSFNPILERTQLAIDRYFYRAIVEPERVLEDLAADLAECEGEGEIRAGVEGKLASALNLEWVKLSQGNADPPQSGAQLVFPVTFRSETMSALSCGGKLSGAPFAASDRDLLLGAASQVGIALRNARSMAALRDAQRDLLRNERLATMGELAGSVAHGVRNPLSGIRASAQIGRQQTSDPAIDETFSGIISESDRLERRVRALLDFSRPFQPTIEDVDVAGVLESVRTSIAPQAARIGVRLEVAAEPGSGLVACDANFLEEALLELAGNALRTLAESGGCLRLSTGRSGDKVWIRVEDDGPGIAENVQSRVFDLFFTTRADGTGMGLALVKRIVDSLGGNIAYSPGIQGGARFEIQLPGAETNPSAAAAG